jgi:serine protease Do
LRRPIAIIVFLCAILVADRGRAEDESLAPLVERLRPAVVNIQALHGDGADDGRSLGSGVIVDDTGLVLTNHHVVDGAAAVRVVLADRRSVRARVVGRDELTDLALLQIPDAAALPTVTFGDSDGVRAGDRVFAIGNPFGLGSTVTAGILSATDRHLGAGAYDGLLQTDAPINPGSSGGPLFNARGEVIGISTAVVENGQGIGFAIPANTARDVLTHLRRRGYVVRGSLGVGIQDVTPELAALFGAPAAGGALVANVDDGSPAARAGFRVGDVIVKYGEQPIVASARLPRLVEQTPPGKRVRIELLRDGRRKVKLVEIARHRGGETGKPLPARAEEPAGPGVSTQSRGGEPGIVVTDVDPRGPFAAALAPGDVILDIDRHPVEEPAELTRRLSKGHAALLRLRRGDTTVFVLVDL